MKTRGYLRAVWAATVALLLSGCPLTPEEGELDIPDVSGEPHSDLFVEQIDSPGTFVFLTNDQALQGPYGCTLWALREGGQDPFAERELELVKLSGDNSAGYGAVICQRDDDQWGETMLVVMINASRQYIVGEVLGAQFEVIVPWTDCAALYSGSAVNRLRVLREAEAFTVSFNGQETLSFRDEEAPLHSGGADGWIVVISPLDRLAETGVHVVFKEL
jgi:hypothetical protein